jgi:predicted AAA+ superfamily ATPase
MQGKNKPLLRYLEAEIKRLIAKRQSGLILGPRQVGKTTLVRNLLSDIDNRLEYFFQIPSVRLETETDPDRIIREVEAEGGQPLVFVDEAQKVPEVFDSAQYLIDEKKASFILTGSSARKLKRSGVNLLPGRIKRFYLDPLLWGELGFIKKNNITELAIENINKKTGIDFEDTLIYGSLPGIINQPEKDRKDFLGAYSQIYLEEEIRAEALSRNMGAFSRFLELAAAESGTSPNVTKLSNESGVSQPAIKEFYNVLVDTLIVERVEPYLKNSRKRILSSPRYYFFDIGVRNSIARLPLDRKTINAQKGILFEHAVMLEIIRRTRALGKNYKVCFWRTAGGAEVDCVVDTGTSVIPIEIKSSKVVALSELKGLKSFLADYKKSAKHGYVITMGEKKEKLTENITALPWFNL